MKKTVILTLVVGIMTLFSANAQKEMDQFMVQVDGLGCPFCAYGLEKKFKEFKGIKKVKIDIETGDFSFSYPAEKALTMEAVEKQVEKAGYTPITSKIIRANGSVEESGTSVSAIRSDKSLIAEKIHVAGKCGMCEARILKATKDIPGVATASWDVDTKMLLVNFDPTATSMNAIEEGVAAAGHDTKNIKATDSKYKGLPACCKYERIEY